MWFSGLCLACVYLWCSSLCALSSVHPGYWQLKLENVTGLIFSPLGKTIDVLSLGGIYCLLSPSFPLPPPLPSFLPLPPAFSFLPFPSPPTVLVLLDTVGVDAVFLNLLVHRSLQNGDSLIL